MQKDIEVQEDEDKTEIEEAGVGVKKERDIGNEKKKKITIIKKL